MVSGTRHADGRLVVTSWRCLWKSEAIKFTCTDGSIARAASDVSSQREETYPFAITLSIAQSATDDEAVAAVTAAAVSAALKGAMPIP